VVLKDYSHLPTSFVRVESADALAKLLAQPGVARVVENVTYEVHLTESLPLIHQPEATAAGFDGAGATVAVLDTGIDPDLYPGVFGDCSNGYGSLGCRIAVLQAFVGTGKDQNSHGTHVSATAIGVAPDARVAAVAVCDALGQCNLAEHVIPGIDWVLANRDTYNNCRDEHELRGRILSDGLPEQPDRGRGGARPRLGHRIGALVRK
jgi:subtilisin family serine protease